MTTERRSAFDKAVQAHQEACAALAEANTARDVALKEQQAATEAASRAADAVRDADRRCDATRLALVDAALACAERAER